MAEIVARKHFEQIKHLPTLRVASAGTHAVNGKIDPRAEATLKARGYKPVRFKSRRVEPSDFESFDLILAMDAENLAALERTCPAPHLGKLRLFLSFVNDAGQLEVPDPYYGNVQGFEHVLDLCELGVNGVMTHLRS